MSEIGDPPPTGPLKGASAFRTIGEVADDLDLPAHVLRFWESKFAQLKPLKRRGGRRYYRPEDIVLLRRIRQCLYQDGYTIRGVQKLLGVDAGRSAPTTDRASVPSLFPLDAGPDPAADRDRPPRPETPAQRPRRRPPKPDARAALEEIRRELLEARALLEALMHGPRVP
ncbi:MAG TPA: MerR family transcriptional regulator [Stellaceae bacterium]|nr:MerR family transcriptional regulator [Stellaceae bacterium]